MQTIHANTPSPQALPGSKEKEITNAERRCGYVSMVTPCPKHLTASDPSQLSDDIKTLKLNPYKISVCFNSTSVGLQAV